MKRKVRIGSIWNFVKPYKIGFFNLFFCTIVADYVSILYPYIFGLLIDEVLYHRNMDFFRSIIISYVVIYAGEALIFLLQTYLWTYLYTRFLFDIRKRIFEKIMSLKAAYLDKTQSGDLCVYIDRDTGEFMDFIHWSIFYVATSYIKLVTIAVFVVLINYKVAVLTFVITPISVYAALFFGERVKSRFAEYREKYGKYIGWVYEIINGMREIQLLAGERNVTGFFVRQCADLIRLKIKASLMEQVSERAIAFLSLISDLSLYILSAVLIFRRELTLGGFFAISGYFTIAKNTLKLISEKNIRMQNNMASINKVFDLLGEEEEQNEKHMPDIAVSNGEIRYRGVEFQYNTENKVLEDIELNISGGQKISIVGRSGSGKSTMVRLLLGLYKPARGTIEIDGKNIQQYSVRSLRRAIGMVQQETLLFNGTIRYNLRLGRKNCTEAEMMKALDKAFIGDFIRSLPEGLDTVLGTGGVDLSGGQKQRIAIARIFLKNPKILIFDEATSALDREAEMAVHKAWEELSCGRTCIIIAHRLSTILGSDKVAVLNNGRIISFAHHLNLLENCEYYSTLFKEQYEGQEKTAL